MREAAQGSAGGPPEQQIFWRSTEKCRGTTAWEHDAGTIQEAALWLSLCSCGRAGSGVAALTQCAASQGPTAGVLLGTSMVRREIHTPAQ